MKRKKMIFGKLTIIDVNYVKPCRILLQFYTFYSDNEFICHEMYRTRPEDFKKVD